MSVTAIISGGQTGADLGALQAGINLGLAVGGFAPKGWMTERGPQRSVLEGYGLTEWHEPGYPARTEANVGLADATIIFGKSSGGSLLTRELCLRLKKPVIWVGDLRVFDTATLLSNYAWVHDWLTTHTPEVLNVAGNRESVSPGIERAVMEFLVHTLSVRL